MSSEVYERLFSDYREWPKLLLETLGLEYPGGEAVEGRAILAGMGGSSHGARILARCYGEDKIVVVSDFHPRVSVGKGDLVVAISASGNTLETIQVFVDAVRQGAEGVAIAGGGRLLEEAAKLAARKVKIRTLSAPRSSFPSLYAAPAVVLESYGLVKGARKHLEDLAKKLNGELEKTISAEGEPALIAEWAKHKKLVVYSSWYTEPVAWRFSAMLNEYAKIRSYVRIAPELAHNEIEALSNVDSIIFIRDPASEDRELKAALDSLKELAVEVGAAVLTVDLPREYACLARAGYAVFLLDLAAIWLARKIGVEDPYRTPNIDLYKQKLRGRLA